MTRRRPKTRNNRSSGWVSDQRKLEQIKGQSRNVPTLYSSYRPGNRWQRAERCLRDRVAGCRSRRGWQVGSCWGAPRGSGQLGGRFRPTRWQYIISRIGRSLARRSGKKQRQASCGHRTRSSPLPPTAPRSSNAIARRDWPLVLHGSAPGNVHCVSGRSCQGFRTICCVIGEGRKV